MIYSPHPPYEILQNGLLDFSTMQRLRRFARYWDLLGNSGNFVATTPLLWAADDSPFDSFLAFSDWLFAQIQRTHTIALDTLARHLWSYLVEHIGRAAPEVSQALVQDWRRTGRKDLPPWLEEHQSGSGMREPAQIPRTPRRQARHVGAN
jgi:hypothetical protein